MADRPSKDLPMNPDSPDVVRRVILRRHENELKMYNRASGTHIVYNFVPFQTRCDVRNLEAFLRIPDPLQKWYKSAE